MNDSDVIVVGLGAMGSAAAYHLARRGLRVLGFDRYAPPHTFGSSHGRSRIIREAYYEDPCYVPLVRRAYDQWAALEAESGEALFVRTGGLMLGPPDSVLVTGALRSAHEHALPHETLSAAEVHRRVPGFRPAEEMVGVWEPRAGYLVPERAIATHLTLATRHGADLHTTEPVTAWRALGSGVEVTTSHGTYRAGHLVLAAGAWTSQLLGDLRVPLAVERQVSYWFRPHRPTSLYDPAHFPIFICEYAPGRMWYGFPDAGDGIKVGIHHQGERVDPDTIRRTVSPEEIATIRGLLGTFMPDAEGELLETAVCMYTNTPDEHFVVDRHPAYRQVLVASPCSGHGFKFSSALGDHLATLVCDPATTMDLTAFGVGRFAVARL